MAFDALFKKYFVVVLLGLIALSAYFEAKGATQLFGAALLMSASSSAPALGVAAPALSIPQREPRTAEPLIERNPFDSVTGSLYPKPEPELAAKPVEPDLSDPLSAAACDGISAFIITESTDDRDWSVAALQGAGEPHPRLRRVGDDVGGRRVAFIGFNPRENSPSVWLTSADALCQVLLFRTAPPPVAAAAPVPAEAPVVTPRRGPTPVPPDIAAKIQKVSDTEFNVDRSVVDKILENQADLMRSARIVPEQRDGKVVGIRLFGVRPDTLLGTLGLQNGDRLDSINNFNMGSPEKALEAYATLRTAPRLDVKVFRQGSPVNIGITIK